MKSAYVFILAAILFSCSETKKAVDANIQNRPGNTVQVKDEKKMLQSGTAFTAQGSSPLNWSLEMNYGKNVTFTAEDGIALTFAYNKLKKTQAEGKTTYTGNVSAGEISIITEDRICTNPQERKVYNKSVSVTIKSKVYTGCGIFLSDANLSGEWLLEKIGNTVVVAAEYNKIPALSFDLIKNRVSGNDGCNNIGSNIEVQGYRIKFSGVSGTKIGCTKKNIETIISTQLSGRFVDYYFKEGKLYLYLPDDSVLVFTKG